MIEDDHNLKMTKTRNLLINRSLFQRNYSIKISTKKKNDQNLKIFGSISAFIGNGWLECWIKIHIMYILI